VDELIDRALAEDVGNGDLTTGILVPQDLRATARIEQKEAGVIAGLDVAAAVFERFDVELEPSKDVVARLAGPAAGILTAERTALNFLGRLSGIATLTARYVKAVDGTGVQILDTRKTTPGLRELEKAAVLAGGGTSYRMGLYDAVMIKENHAAIAGGLAAATRRAVAEAPGGVPVCVECETPEDVDIAIEAGAQRLLAGQHGAG
jgi:nicotinate-nucleotide pyrophosphorylase (carboxylating)